MTLAEALEKKPACLNGSSIEELKHAAEAELNKLCTGQSTLTDAEISEIGYFLHWLRGGFDKYTPEVLQRFMDSH